MISTGSLLLAGAAAAIGGAGSAINRKKAKDEELRSYQQAREFLDSQYYRDPLTTVGNRSLLKAAERNYQDNLEGLNNRMVAGGATMENQLAARKANNESRDKLYGQLLQGEDARRDRINTQKLGLDQQHSAAVQAGYQQAAQDWSQWGGQMAQAALAYGSTGLLDAGVDASKYAGDMDKYRDAIDALAKTQPESQGYEYMPLAPARKENLGGLTSTV